jgi:protein SCO1/2
MRKLSLLKKIIVLVLILALPGFLYYQLTVKGKNRYHALTIFGPKQVTGTYHKVNGKNVPDTIYHQLPDFNLFNQNGQKVSLSSFDNKISVVDFFYTNCPNICKQMNENLDSLAKEYGNNKLMQFVSITVDPQRDTEQALKDYSGQFKIPASKWLFLTGDTTTIYPLARTGFLVNAVKAGNDDFIYSDKIILIDSEKRIRGYYTGTVSDEFDRLDNEIKVLLSEELMKNSTPEY